jgi:hypothetical protein
MLPPELLYVSIHAIMHASVVPTLRKVREEWGTHRVIGTSSLDHPPRRN